MSSFKETELEYDYDEEHNVLYINIGPESKSTVLETLGNNGVLIKRDSQSERITEIIIVDYSEDMKNLYNQVTPVIVTDQDFPDVAELK